MKPPPFEYDAPTTVDEAVSLLGEHGDDAKVIAGGQSLIPMLALRLARPTRLIDVGAIDELGAIRADASGLSIGASVTQRRAERDATVATRSPALAGILPLIAHPAIRNRGTIGGSLAHADPAAELPAAALLLEAGLVARSTRGERTIPAAEFFEGFLTTVLAADELLVDVRLPDIAGRSGWAVDEISRRHGDFALVGAATLVVVDDAGIVTDARIALWGVASTAVRVPGAEQLLVGSQGAAAVDDAVAAVTDQVSPSADVHASASYRRHVAGVLTRRTLHAALARAEGGVPA